MSEILTPERVLELGQEWKRLLLSDLPPEELDAYVNPDYKRALLNSGREEGEKLGKLETLAHILQHRLGEMPATVRERLSHCTVTQLNASSTRRWMPQLGPSFWLRCPTSLRRQTSTDCKQALQCAGVMFVLL